METKDKFIIAKYIDDSRANIIQKYAENMPISDIAKLYDVAKSTIYLRLVKWGVKIKRYTGARRRKNERPRRQKRQFSPELLVRMAENSRINDEHISYVEFKRSTYDQKLVDNILCKPILG